MLNIVLSFPGIIDKIFEEAIEEEEPYQMVFFYHQYVHHLKNYHYEHHFNQYLLKNGYDLESDSDFTRMKKFQIPIKFTMQMCSPRYRRIFYINQLDILENLLLSMRRFYHYYLILRILNNEISNIFIYLLSECVSVIYLQMDGSLIFKLKNNEVFNFSEKFNKLLNPFVKLLIYNSLKELIIRIPIEYSYLKLLEQTIGDILEIPYQNTRSLPGIICDYVYKDIEYPSLYKILNIDELFTDKKYDSNTNTSFSPFATSVYYLVPKDMTCRGNKFYFYMLYTCKMNEFLSKGQLEFALKCKLDMPSE